MRLPLAVDEERGPAILEADFDAVGGVHDYRPLLALGPAPVEARGERPVRLGAGEKDLGRDRRLRIPGNAQRGFADEEAAGEDARGDGEGVDPGVEHAEPARLPDPLLARVPLGDILVPDDLHRGDALSRERVGRGLDRRMVASMPRGEERDWLRLGEAGEVGDLAQAHRRRLFEQAVKAGEDALASDLVARPGGRGDRHGLEPVDGADHLAPVGEGLPNALPRAARRGDQIETRIALDRGHVLVGGDLAEADDGDFDRPHQRRSAAT